MRQGWYKQTILGITILTGFVIPSFVLAGGGFVTSSNVDLFSVDFYGNIPPGAQSVAYSIAYDDDPVELFDETQNYTVVGIMAITDLDGGGSVSLNCSAPGYGSYYTLDTGVVGVEVAYIAQSLNFNCDEGASMTAFCASYNYCSLQVIYVPWNTQDVIDVNEFSGSLYFGIAVLIFFQAMIFMGLLFKSKDRD